MSKKGLRFRREGEGCGGEEIKEEKESERENLEKWRMKMGSKDFLVAGVGGVMKKTIMRQNVL